MQGLWVLSVIQGLGLSLGAALTHDQSIIGAILMALHTCISIVIQLLMSGGGSTQIKSWYSRIGRKLEVQATSGYAV